MQTERIFPGIEETAIPVTQHSPPTPPKQVSEQHEPYSKSCEPRSQVSRNQ